MATKADLERDHGAYLACARRAVAATQERAYNFAVDECVRSLSSLPGYADFERRFVKAPAVHLPTLDALFRFAPPLFRRDAVRAAEAFAAANPKLGKKLGRDVAADARDCRRALFAAARLWNELTAASAGAPLRAWRADAAPPAERGAVEVWEKLGLFTGAGASSYGPRFAAGMGGEWVGLCPACGTARRAGKLAMLSPLTCRACGKDGSFVVQGQGGWG